MLGPLARGVDLDEHVQGAAELGEPAVEAGGQPQGVERLELADARQHGIDLVGLQMADEGEVDALVGADPGGLGDDLLDVVLAVAAGPGIAAHLGQGGVDGADLVDVVQLADRQEAHLVAVAPGGLAGPPQPLPHPLHTRAGRTVHRHRSIIRHHGHLAANDMTPAEARTAKMRATPAKRAVISWYSST